MKVIVFLFFLILTLFSSPYKAEVGLSLTGDESLTINKDQAVTGDIELSGNAVLTIESSTVILERGENNPRGDIKLTGNAMLILKDASLVPPLLSPDNLHLLAEGNSRIEITNSTIFNVLNLVENAVIKGTKARIFSSSEPYNIPENVGGFGIVQLSDNAKAEFTDSTIGSFALFFFSDESAELSNLKPQKYSDFDLQRDTMISSNINIVLKNSEVLPTIARGPFERGWTIFSDPNSRIQIADSILNKFVFQEFKNETVEFKDLKLNTPINFNFRNIDLSNVTIQNQWGFFGTDSNIRILDSKEVWLFQFETGIWELIRTVMNEFDPRRFTGTLVFEDSEWTNAGEIFEDTNMEIKGTVKITGGLEEHLQFSNSKVTREFPVEILTKKGKKVKRFTASVLDEDKVLTEIKGLNGIANVSLIFDDENYKKKFILKLSTRGKSKSLPISFFDDTPIIIRL